MSLAIKADIAGTRPALAKLAGLPEACRRRILPRAVRAGTALVRKAAKHNAPVGKYGQLKRSIGSKIKTYQRGEIVIGVIGPRTGMRIAVGTWGKVQYHDPAKIAHLVEFGHGGPAPAPPHPFMRPAWDQEHSAAADTMNSAILAGIEEEAKR